MAARNTRRRANSLANVVPVRDTQVTQTVSRYDMSFPQNWTVEQLRSELTRNSVSFRKTDKKARLIQLCKDNGLISTRNSIPDGLTNSQQDVENSELTKLTNTVAELQNTVAMLSRNVDKLSQNNSVSTQNVSSNSAGSSVPIMSGTIQFPEVSCESPQPTFTSSTGGITDGQSMVAAASTGVSGMNLGAVTPTMGTQTRFGFSVESLPFIETVHPTLRKQIVEGEDINLAALLIPYYTGNHADSAEIIKDKDRPDPRLQNSLTLPQFIQAFGIYKNILCEVYPSRREELDLYERDIVDMASRYGGKGFYEYHRMFSAEAAAHLRYANRKVDWSVRNNKLFTTIFVNQRANTCNLCNSSLHVSSFCPTQLVGKGNNHNSLNKGSNDVRGRMRVSFQGKEICNNFNGQAGCNFRGCRNLHICLICKKEHSQHSCIMSKNSQSGKGNSQK